MTTQRKRIDITSADSKQLGFEYQYLYFIVKLFSLSRGDEVGYETLDDVHTISFHEQKTYLYQLKHTIDATPLGEQVNLTTLSEDLWKTLSNWSKLISDPLEGRIKKDAQKQFIETSCFILVTNRRVNANEMINKMTGVKQGIVNGSDFLNYIKQLQAKTKNIEIKEYMNDIIKLGVAVSQAFIKNVEIIDSPNNLFDTIRDGIRDKMVPEEYIDDIFGNLYRQLKEDFFNKVTSGQRQIITYEDWITKYREIFNQYRSTLLPLREYNPILPEHLDEQFFVKELIEIGAVDMDDFGLSEIAEYTNHYLSITMQLEDWYKEGRITHSSMLQFHKDAILQWKNIHRTCHRLTKGNSGLDCQNALNCFDKIMDEKLGFMSTALGVEKSNGEFIKLADEKKIGWKYAWKDRYFKNGH